MIEHAVDSMNIKGNYIFVVRKFPDQALNDELKSILLKYTSAENILEVDHLTEGPVCSALLAREKINNSEPLLLTNCDQIMDWDSTDFQEHLKNFKYDGLVVTYPSSNPANSYIAVDENGIGTRLAEKEVISNYSLNGIHYFKHGSLFVDAADSIIKKNIRVNNEFYVSLCFNEMVQNKLKVTAYHLSPGVHWAVGVPADLTAYLEHMKNKSV